MTWRPEGDFGVLAEFPPSFKITKEAVEIVLDGIFDRRSTRQVDQADMEMIILATIPGALVDLVLTLTGRCILN